MKNKKYRIIKNNISNYSFKDNFIHTFKSNFTLNNKNKYSRNHSNEKEINNSNINLRTYINYNLTQNKKLKKEKERNNSFNNINNNNLKLSRIKFIDLKKKIKEKNFQNENSLNLSFNLKSKKNNDINKKVSSQYLITYFNYEIISIKSKKNLNDSLKNDIIILMKQLKEKESQILTMNEHIKLLNEELKRVKNKKLKLLNYIQKLENKRINTNQLVNSISLSDEHNSIYLNNLLTFNSFLNLQVSHQFSLSLNVYKKNYFHLNNLYTPKKINKNNKKESDKLIFKPYDNTHFLKYDIINNIFELISFPDYNNYSLNFNKDNYSYLNLNGNLYIITGKNNDMFYIFNYKKKSLNRLNNLKFNHTNCGLIKYDNKIISLSGNFTKKVETYDLKSNKWNDSLIKELNQERSKSSYLIINNYIIYTFYGYNYIKSKFINNIEFYDVDNNLWKEININNNINGLIEHITYINLNNDIIIFGGFNENGFNNNYYKLNLDNKNLTNESNSEYNILFNSQIIELRNDFDNENNIICFDKNNNIHKFSYNDISNNQILFYN